MIHPPPPATRRPSRRAALSGLAALAAVPLPAAAEIAAPTPAAPTTPRFTLRAAPVQHRLLPEPAGEAELWSFGEGAVVPVLRIRLGEEVVIHLVNDTTVPLSLHWQGVRNSSAADGVGGLSHPPVPPGGTHDYRFTPPDAGTFLARPFCPGDAGPAAARGLAALLVVEETAPPAVDADHAILVRDWRVASDGALMPPGDRAEAALAGRLGNRFGVGNGDAPLRIVGRPGSRLRLRLANGCNARITRLRFDGARVAVAAVDGQPTESFEPLRASLPFAPGSRFDLVVDLPAAAGPAGTVVATLGPGVPLVEIVAEGDPIPATPAPPTGAWLQPNRLLPAEIRLQNAYRREIAIMGGATRGPGGDPVFPPPDKPIWTLGGAPGSAAAAPFFTVRRGTPVVLTFVNATGFPQPLHVHGHVVRLLHGLDDGWEPYWLDTVPVTEGKIARVAFVADNPGRWAISSAVLERFDTGLWGHFVVT